MTEHTTPSSEREEIEMLVPFYVTGRISADDSKRVDAYLKRNPDFAEHIELVRDERAVTVSANEALGFPSARSTDKIFETIAQETQTAPSRRVQDNSSSIWAAIGRFFAAPTPSAVRFVAIAAAAVVLVQTAFLGTLLMRQPAPDGYQTASGPSNTAMRGTVALVAFQDGASVSDISRALANEGASIVEGPIEGGMYKIKFIHGSDGEAGAQSRFDALKSQTAIVKSLLPSR